MQHTEEQKKHALAILDGVTGQFPDAKIELCFDTSDPWQLLTAVVLSAQCTDVKVNKATPALFAKFPNVVAFAKAKPEDVEPYIESLGLFRSKAKYLVNAAKRIVEEFDGKVPQSRAVLETLPGVGSKSAAVIVANAFGKQAIAVDTHVGRVSRRMGLTTHKDPSKVEKELTFLLPEPRLLEAHHAFIWHGRRICHARKPECSKCPVQEICPKIDVAAST